VDRRAVIPIASVMVAATLAVLGGSRVTWPDPEAVTEPPAMVTLALVT